MSEKFGMNDKQFRDVMLCSIVALAIYFYFKKRASDVQSVPDATSDPMILSFANNPQQFLPPEIGVTVNVPSAFGGKYTPLFGFVGIAQGEMLA